MGAINSKNYNHYFDYKTEFVSDNLEEKLIEKEPYSGSFLLYNIMYKILWRYIDDNRKI